MFVAECVMHNQAAAKIFWRLHATGYEKSRQSQESRWWPTGLLTSVRVPAAANFPEAANSALRHRHTRRAINHGGQIRSDKGLLWV